MIVSIMLLDSSFGFLIIWICNLCFFTCKKKFYSGYVKKREALFVLFFFLQFYKIAPTELDSVTKSHASVSAFPIFKNLFSSILLPLLTFLSLLLVLLVLPFLSHHHSMVPSLYISLGLFLCHLFYVLILPVI